jgi:hypothetical protein
MKLVMKLSEDKNAMVYWDAIIVDNGTTAVQVVSRTFDFRDPLGFEREYELMCKQVMREMLKLKDRPMLKQLLLTDRTPNY